jgi:phosphatidylinositol kinase/protein kinase (PI-3  family)
MLRRRDIELETSSQASKWTEQLAQVQVKLRARSDEDRFHGATDLARFVAAQARELSNETFAKFMEDLNVRLAQLLEVNQVPEKLGVLAAIDALIEVDHVNQWMSSAVQSLFSHKDVAVITAAAQVLGKFARFKGTMYSEFLESQLKASIDLLVDTRNGNPLVALLILRQLAENAPSLFYIQAGTFVDAIWVGLHHKSIQIRLAAASALNAALTVLSQRDSNSNVHTTWYSKLFGKARELSSKNPDVTHGSLLALQEILLKVNNAFMENKFKPVCDEVIKCHTGNSNKLVRQTIVSLLAVLAHRQPSEFALFYLQPIMNQILLAAFKKDNDRNKVLMTIGGIALAVQSTITPYLDDIFKHIKTALGPKKSTPTLAIEALSCLAMLAESLTPSDAQVHLTERVRTLLDLIFAQPLSPTMVETLSKLAKHIPSLAVGLQVRLMDMISYLLDGKAFKFPDAPSKLYYSGRAGKVGSAPAVPPYATQQAERDPQIITLALRTLFSFSFSKAFLSEFLCKVVVNFLKHESPLVRQEAVITSAQLTISLIAGTAYQQQTTPYMQLHSSTALIYAPTPSSHVAANVQTRGHSANVANQILSRLLDVAVTDSEAIIRLTVLDSLDPCFDAFLAQADLLHLLFIALNDEQFEIRSAAINAVCRLATKNPAYVFPALRKKLLQLLSELQYSDDGLGKEQSALALSQLIAGSRRLTQPYTLSIFNSLIGLVSDSDTRVAAQVMEALGQLARVSNMAAHIDTLLPTIIDTLQDQSSQSKRRAALETLGHLVQSTGYVITPVLKYPKLLDIMLNIIKTENTFNDMKYQVIKVLGILGALDPDKQRQSALRMQKKRKALQNAAQNLDRNAQPEVDPNMQTGLPAPTGDAAPPPTEAAEAPAPTGDPTASENEASLNLTPSSEEYYPTCAVNALLTILRDPSLSPHHQNAVVSIMYMFSSLGLRCVPFLTQIMPSLLHLVRTSEARFKEFLFQQLGVLVTIVKQHIRDYLSDIFKLTKEYWHVHMYNLATLVEKVAIALNDEFVTYMPLVMPLILGVLHSEQPSARRKTIRLSQTLEVFGTLLDDYQHVVLPALVKLFEVEHPDSDIEVAIAAIRCVGRLSTKLPVQDFAARIIHPLLRTMDPAQGFTLIASDPTISKEFGAAPPSSTITMSATSSMRDLSTPSPSSATSALGNAFAEGDALQHGTSQSYQDLARAGVHTLCLLICQLQQDFRMYLSVVARVLPKVRTYAPLTVYEELVRLLNAAYKKPDTEQEALERKVTQILKEDEKSSPAAVFRQQSNEAVVAMKLKVNEQSLARAWDTSKRSTKEDWAEWIRKFSVELLRESPSPALRGCVHVSDYLPVVRTLFNASFVSCWNELSVDLQDQLVRSLETALTSPNIPPEILQYLLDLAEFMEHVNTKFPMDKHKLGVMAEKCHAYAKALYYKEIEFKHKPDNLNTIESLISINNKLGLPQAANGILQAAQTKNAIQLRDSWFEKLGRWEEALDAYTKRASSDHEGLLGRMRCLNALGEWETILIECWPYYQGQSAIASASAPNTPGGPMSLNNFSSAMTSVTGSSMVSSAGGLSLSSSHNNLRHSATIAWQNALNTNSGTAAALGTLASPSQLRPHSQLHSSSSTLLADLTDMTAAASLASSSGAAHSQGRQLRSTLSPHLQLNALPPADAALQKMLAPLACSAAWYLQDWEKLERFSEKMDSGTPDGAFYRALLHLHKDEFETAQAYVNVARQALDTELTALFSESYQRAYTSLVQVQQLSELEEVIAFKQGDSEQRNLLKRIWSQRLKGCQRDLDVWRRLLSVRAMVVPPHHDLDPWLEFASLARKNGRLALAHKILNQLAESGGGGSMSSSRLNLHGDSGLIVIKHHAVSMPNHPGYPSSSNTSGTNLSMPGSPLTGQEAINAMVVSPRGEESPGMLRTRVPARELAVPEITVSSQSPRTSSGGPMHPSHASNASSSTEHTQSPQSQSQAQVPVFTRHASGGNASSETTAVPVRSSSNAMLPSGSLLSMSTSSLPDPAETKETTQPMRIDLSRVRFAQIKQQWAEGNREHAQNQLRRFARMVPPTDQSLLARVAYTTGQWIQQSQETLDDSRTNAIIAEYRQATKCEPSWYKAWHAWALVNYETVQRIRKEARMLTSQGGMLRSSAGVPAASSSGSGASSSTASAVPTFPTPLSASAGNLSAASSASRTQLFSQEMIKNNLVPAIVGFFRSIALNPGQNLQDILRLLTLWFDYGHDKLVESTIQELMKQLVIDAWLPVIPQIIARIHTPSLPVRRLLQALLTSIGKEHPQALVYALTVASKSQSPERLQAAQTILEKMRSHSTKSASLVDQAAVVSTELIRVAILWHEMWYDGLEEASRQYFGEKNVEGMLATLRPLHKMMEKGGETVREVNFQTNFKRELDDAAEWCKKFTISRVEADLTHAWDLYYHVFRKINKLPQMSILELKNVSPKLLTAHNMDLAVPGTYKAKKEVVRILKFHPVLKIITSKQRPRKLNIVGSDGLDYNFLLKGREDLRQDERVMQLFGLVNALLRKNARSRVSLGSIVDLSIQPYSVIPLSPQTGLLGWVPHTDTIHQLVREYRQSRGVPLNIEHRFILKLTSDYDNLTLMQKVEVFEHAMEASDGMDLERVLWLKSPNSEVWLERRTNFTTSLATMSMVGYILGLGDRHPSNLMLDRHTGKIIHIDFGDCFEVAMHRDKYPEKVPFRLTRMLVNAMDVSGIDGLFRTICEVVMGVLRENKESLMAVLEAFVHDPLINWRLLNNPSPSRNATAAPSATTAEAGATARATVHTDPSSSNEDLYSPQAPEQPHQLPPNTSHSLARSFNPVLGFDGADVIRGPDRLNERALVVINRVSDKLSGRDFDKNQRLDVAEQVQKLIKMATSKENLCQAYLGWVGHW